eukprot:761860-Hanusia_phi.AAC.1
MRLRGGCFFHLSKHQPLTFKEFVMKTVRKAKKQNITLSLHNMSYKDLLVYKQVIFDEGEDENNEAEEEGVLKLRISESKLLERFQQSKRREKEEEEKKLSEGKLKFPAAKSNTTISDSLRKLVFAPTWTESLTRMRNKFRLFM